MTKKLITFYVLTFLFTILVAVIQETAKIDFEIVILPQLGPSLAAFATLFLFKGLQININLSFDKTLINRKLIAFFVPLLIMSITFGLAKILGLNVSITNEWKYALPIIIGGMLVGAIGEEIGWRGFWQPLMEQHLGLLKGTILLGLFWGLWHVGQYQNGALFMFGFLMFAVSASLILRQILEKTNFNVWVAVTFHLAVNLGFFFFFKNALTDTHFMLLNGLVWSVFVVGAMQINRRFF